MATDIRTVQVYASFNAKTLQNRNARGICSISVNPDLLRPV